MTHWRLVRWVNDKEMICLMLIEGHRLEQISDTAITADGVRMEFDDLIKSIFTTTEWDVE